MRFYRLVAVAIFLDALLGFSFLYDWSLVAHYAGATWPQVWTAINDKFLGYLLWVIAAVLYWKVAQARPVLMILAIAYALYGASFVLAWYTTNSLVVHGTMFMISKIHTIGLIVVGVLAVVDFVISVRRRRAAV